MTSTWINVHGERAQCTFGLLLFLLQDLELAAHGRRL